MSVLINPRPYQREAVYQLIPDAFRQGHTSIIRYAPMRSGKSIEQALMAKGAYEKGNRVILLTHRSKIFRSTLHHLSNQGVPCVDFTAGKKMPAGDWKVMLAMERTLWNVIRKNPETILQPNLILVDEIHLNNFSKIIDFFISRGKVFIVAFSGTPKGKHLHKYFSKIIFNVDSIDLIATGDLVRCMAFQMEDKEINQVKKDKGEFDNNEMFKHYNKANRYDGLISEYKEKVNGQKGIVFCCNIEHTVKTYNRFKEEGINAFMCHSGNKNFPMTEKESDEMINAFEYSSDGVMINQGKLDTGYDHPPMMWVAVDRATTSLQLWLQMASRAATPYKGKTFYTLLDFGMNHNRHGLVHQPRTWTLDPPKKRKEQPAAVKTCPSCGAMLYATVRVCEFCKYEFPKPTHELKEGVMVEVNTDIPLGLIGKRISELSLEELIKCQRTKKFKHTYIWRVLRSKDEGALLGEYAKSMGYKNGWLFSERKKIQDGEVGFKDYIIR